MPETLSLAATPENVGNSDDVDEKVDNSDPTIPRFTSGIYSPGGDPAADETRDTIPVGRGEDRQAPVAPLQSLIVPRSAGVLLPVDCRTKIHKSITDVLDWSGRDGLRESEIIGNNSYKFYHGAEITPEMVTALARIFRKTFISSFPEYSLCQSCQKTDPVWKVFGMKEETEVDLSSADNPENLPNCTNCGEKMEFFYDPQKTEEALREKLSNKSYLVTIFDLETSKMSGYTFSYEGSLEDVFKNEWENQYGYAKEPRNDRKRNFQRFMNLVIPAINKIMSDSPGLGQSFDANSAVMCWNCTILSPDTRKTAVLAVLLNRFISMWPESANLPVIGETMKGSNYNRIMKRAGAIEIEGFLEDGYVLICGSVNLAREMMSRFNRRLTKK